MTWVTSEINGKPLWATLSWHCSYNKTSALRTKRPGAADFGAACKSSGGFNPGNRCPRGKHSLWSRDAGACRHHLHTSSCWSTHRVHYKLSLSVRTSIEVTRRRYRQEHKNTRLGSTQLQEQETLSLSRIQNKSSPPFGQIVNHFRTTKLLSQRIGEGTKIQRSYPSSPGSRTWKFTPRPPSPSPNLYISN